MLRLKWLPGCFFLAICVVYLSALTWADLGNYRLTVYIAATLVVFCGIAAFMHSRVESLKNEQYRILLEYLSGRLSAGYTLELSLIQAAENLSERFGKRSLIRQILLRLNRELNAQLDLEGSLNRFQNDFNCPAGSSFFDLLPFLRRYGGRLDVFVRQTYRSLCAELQLKKDLAAEQSAKNSEAMVLSALPFILSFILLRSHNSYVDSLSEVDWSIAVLCLLFLTSHLAIALTLWILSRHVSSYQVQSIFLNLSARPVRLGIINFLATRIRRLTGLFGYRLVHSVQILTAGETDNWSRYIRRKCFISVAFLIVLSALCAMRIFSIHTSLIILTASWLLPDLDILQRERKLKQQVRLEYPQFLNAMVILLKSGLTLDHSLRLMIDSYAKRIDCQLNRDLKRMGNLLGRGEGAAQAIEQLAADIPQTEIASILQLMARYDRDGGQELLEIMQIQATASWQLYRNAVRGRLERRNLRLIIPMGIDLLTIIILAMLPAIASLTAMY